jgi:hypothetical protein
MTFISRSLDNSKGLVHAMQSSGPLPTSSEAAESNGSDGRWVRWIKYESGDGSDDEE